MCNFVVGRACVLCHGQPVGEDAEESLVGKGGGGSRKRNEVEEGGEISLARYRCHGQFLSSYLLEGGGGPRLKIVTRTVPGKCVSRESESGGRARVELELMIHTDGTSFKIVRPSYVVPVVVFLVRGKLLVVLETENAENLCRK